MTPWPTLSIQSVQSLQFTLEHSRTFLAAIVVVHALAAIASFSNALPFWLQGLLFSGVVLSLSVLLKRYIFPDDADKEQVAWTQADGWRLRCGGQDAIPVRLLGSSVVTGIITILHFKTEQGRRHQVVVFRDALDAERYRLLRVVLRTMASGS